MLTLIQLNLDDAHLLLASKATSSDKLYTLLRGQARPTNRVSRHGAKLAYLALRHEAFPSIMAFAKHLENEAVELNKLSEPDQPVISDDDQLLTLRASTRVQYERVWGRFDDLAEEDRTWERVNSMLQTYEYEHYKNKSSGVKSFITSTKELCRLYRSGNCYKSQADCRYSHAGGAKLQRTTTTTPSGPLKNHSSSGGGQNRLSWMKVST